jgi:hypothetical protein
MTQDAAVTEPTVRLRLVLALLRILAGRRGRAGVTWHGAGFTYLLTVVREDGDDQLVGVDSDPDAIGGDVAIVELRRRLRS